MTQFDWNSIVDEAIALRKREGLTQRDLAPLAGVSLPTLVKFEKKNRSIQLGKAEQILLALGLAENPNSTVIKLKTEGWSSLQE